MEGSNKAYSKVIEKVFKHKERVISLLNTTILLKISKNPQQEKKHKPQEIAA